MRKKIIAEGYPIFFFRLFPLLDKKYSISPLWTRILIYIYIYFENIISNWYRRNTVIFIATSSIIVKIDRLSTFSRSGVSFSVSKAKILARIYILYIFALHKLDTVVSQILFSPPSPSSFLLVRFLFASMLFCTTEMNVYMSFILAQSGQMMSSPSVMKPRPTNEVLQPAQMKQSLCQCLSSKEMKRVPPMPG